METSNCPWCKCTMPEHPALSRLSTEKDRIYVCSECGVLEAVLQYDRGGQAYDWRKEA